MSFTTEIVSTVQRRLADLRYYTGKVDGAAGTLTQAAMAAFKAAHGMRERPYPGPQTMATLFGDTARKYEPPAPAGDEPRWLAEARAWLGTRETSGSGNTRAIMDWAAGLDQWYPGDDVPWCGLFVAHCMATGARDEPQRFNRLGARNWLDYGEACGAKLGAVCVLWRTHRTRSWNGHVFIITGMGDGAIRGIGGNQGDAVSEAWFSADRVLGYRCPTGWADRLPPAPEARPGELSTNEA